MATGGEATANLYEACVPDPANTLGGIKDDTEPEHPSVIGHLVKSLMPGQDLTRVTIPSFFLERRSLLERMADTMMHPDLLLNVSRLEDPVDRIKAITKWFVSGFHYKTVGVKKPYNPIIGETFACYWKHDDGSRTQYFAEQVLHRPPISAIYMENRAHDIAASAHIWTKSQFSAPQTTKSILEGACILTLTNLGEEYYITFPTYYAHNLLVGSLRMEVGDTAYIVCTKTGLRADIDFLQKPMFGGSDKINSLSAQIRRIQPAGAPQPKVGASNADAFKPKNSGEVLFNITGHWDKVLLIAPPKGTQQLFIDIEKTPVSPKYVLPLDKQGPWESRRLWQFTTLELSKRPTVDWSAVDAEKAQLEEEQRMVPCHFKPGSPDFADWKTKKFHSRKVFNPLKGEEIELFLYDNLATKPYTEDEQQQNLIALSRELPDPRGGLNGAGAQDSMVKSMRSIKISERRATAWESF